MAIDTIPRHEEIMVSRSGSGIRIGTAVMLLTIIGLAFLPYIAFQSTTSVLIRLFVLIALASMWNLLAGFGGLVSIGQQAYIGVGAYTVVALDSQGVSPFLAIIFAVVTASLLSIPTSLLAFRLRGDYFAVGTWVIAEVYRPVVIQVDSVGGGDGKSLTSLSGIDPTMRAAGARGSLVRPCAMTKWQHAPEVLT